MGADFGTLFQHADAQVALLLLGKLAQTDRCRESGGTATDDHHIEFHHFAFHQVTLSLSNCYQSSAAVSSGTASNRSATRP